MAKNCIIYNGNQYSENEFANLLLNGELEKLASQRRTTTPITKFQQEIKNKINQINNLFNRKLAIEETKYRAALNSSDDLIKIRKFYSKNPNRIDATNDEIKAELKLDRNADVPKLKFDLIQINKAFKATEAALLAERNMQLKIARGEPIVVKDKLSLTRMLRNLFNLKGTFKTPEGTVTQDVAAATIMDKVLNTIAKRQSIEQGRPIKISDIYKNLLFKKSTMEELLNPLNTVLNQSIYEEGATNLGLDYNSIKDRVEQLEEQGKTTDEIFQATKEEFGYGAYRGTDRKVYIEIKDNAISFTDTRLPNEVIASLAKPTYLYNIIDHSELFAAYPELKYTVVYTKSFADNRNRGFYQLSDKVIKDPLTGKDKNLSVIVLNNKDEKGEEIKNLDDTLSTLLHEIQHNIQTIEGLYSGLSSDSFKELVIENKRVMKQLIIPALEEAQEKNISLAELKKNDDSFWKATFADSLFMNTFDTLKPVTEDDINRADSFLYTLTNFTIGDLTTMYVSQFAELQPMVTEIRSLLTDQQLDQFSPMTDLDTIANNREITPTVGWEEPLIQVLQRRGYMEELLYQVDAFHGSPHDFDRFSLNAIGTGEGAQAFGWGLYFTDLEGIARSYANQLSKDIATVDGKELSFNTLNYLFTVIDFGTSWNENTIQTAAPLVKKAIEESYIPSTEKYLKEAATEFQRNQAKESLEMYKSSLIEINSIINGGKVKAIKNKNIYKVSLHKGKQPSEYTWLEWDKVASPELLELIKNNLTLEQYRKGFQYKSFGGLYLNFEGLKNNSRVYDRLAIALGNNADNYDAKQASLFLLKHGIDGIKYPAESLARGTTSDTARGFNYVVFDENAVQIEEHIKFQLIGKNGAESTDALNNNTLLKDSLDTAEFLHKQGASLNTIFEKTGWMLGTDKMWRKDSDYDIEMIGGKSFNGNQIYKLTDVITYPSFFAAYPEAKNITFSYSTTLPKNTVGNYNGNKNRPHINVNLYTLNKVDRLKILVHEIQHYIQDVEGFHKSAFYSHGKGQNYNSYFTSDKEIESRNVEKRLFDRYNNNGKLKPLTTTQDYKKTIILPSYIRRQEAAAAYQSAGQYSTGNAEFSSLTDMQDIIHAITDPNVSSPLHEVAHKYERYLTAEERAEVLNSYNENNKTTETEWTTAVSEHFARGFEKYLQTGESPSRLLNNIFAAFKQWLTDIYKGILYQNIDIELNDQMKKIYANMIGEDFKAQLEEEIKVEQQAQLNEDGITEDEYNDFVNNGTITLVRLQAIADRIKTNTQLSGRELEILADKTSEINNLLKPPAPVTPQPAAPQATPIITPEPQAEQTSLEKVKQIVDDFIAAGSDFNNVPEELGVLMNPAPSMSVPGANEQLDLDAVLAGTKPLFVSDDTIDNYNPTIDLSNHPELVTKTVTWKNGRKSFAIGKQENIDLFELAQTQKERVMHIVNGIALGFPMEAIYAMDYFSSRSNSIASFMNIYDSFEEDLRLYKETANELKQDALNSTTITNPYSTASQIEMSDNLRIKFNKEGFNITPEELLEQINLGNIEVIKTTDTSNLYILKGEQDPMFSEYGGTLEDAKEKAIIDKQNQDATASSLLEQYKARQNANQQTENTESTTTNGSNEGLETQNPPITNNPKAEVPEQITPQDAENLITPEIDEPIIVNEEPIEEELPTPPPTEFDGFKVGDKVMLNGSERTIEAFKTIGKEVFALVSNRLAGASNLVTIKTSQLKKPKKTKAVIEKEEIVEAAVIQANNRDFKVNPPIEGETLVFEGKEGTIGYTKSGELYIKFPDKTVDFPRLSELSESADSIEAKLKMKGEATEKKNILYAVALRMQAHFPSIEFEIGEYEGDWSGKFSNGKVYINARNADISTPIHEFLHPFVFALKNENEELFNNFIKTLKENGKYKEQLDTIRKSKEYDSATQEELEEEIVVREITPLIRKLIKDDGSFNEEEYEKSEEKYRSIIKVIYNMVLDFIEGFLGKFGVSFNEKRSSKAGTYLEDLEMFDYNPENGRLSVYGKNQEQPKVYAIVGKGNKINIEDAIDILSLSFPKELPRTFEGVLDLLQKRVSMNPDMESTVRIDDEEVKPLLGGFTSEGLSKSSIRNEFTPQVDATFLQTLPIDLTLEEVGTIVAYQSGISIALDKYQKTFETLSDRLYIKSKEDLTDFAKRFKKQLLNLQHTLESRLKSTSITQDMKQRIIADLRTIKPILEQTVTDDNYVTMATDLVASGFTSLYVADKLMSKIRSKIQVGDINNYINELERHLIAAGVKIQYKPNNLRGIRIHNGIVELNKAALLKEGYIPQDISKYVSGKAHSQEDTRRLIQGIQTKVLNAIKVELTQEEIQDLNWQIIALRNYYATFKGFTKSLLTEYSDKLDHSDVMEFSDTLQRAASRMGELEKHMRTLAVDWLYPFFDDLQKTALSNMSREDYDKKYKTQEQFANLLRYANEDNGALDHLFGTIVNSKDPINSTVSQIIASKITANENELGHLVSDVYDMRAKYFNTKGITTEKQRADYIKANFLRKVKVKEEKRDEHNNLIIIDGKIQYEYKERWGFHTEYLEDEYNIARDKYIEDNPAPTAPTSQDRNEWDSYNFDIEEYRKKVKEWEDNNKPKFLNPNFNRLMKDEMFNFLYTKYNKANDKYGEAKLRMGIIPQSFLHESFIQKWKNKIQAVKDFITQAKKKDIKLNNRISGSIKGAANWLVSAEDKVYYEQANPDETIYRSVKTQFLRLLEEDELNFDITDTITAFTEDALKYSSLRDIQGNIENLKLLINGYQAEGIGIGGRKVPQLDQDGNLIWHSKASRPKSKENAENRLNKQLTQFVDDIFYGDKVKEKVIRLWSAPKYKQELQRANEMVRDGKTVQEILEATTFYKDEHGRWKTDVYQNVNINLNKVARNFTFYTSINSLAFNVMSTARNLGIGNFMNFSEGYGAKYYTVKDYLKAQKIYTSNIPQNAQDVTRNRKSKLNQILFNFQAIQGEFRDRYNKITNDKSVIARLFSVDSLFFLQHVAEHQIQGSATIALMLATKVKTNTGEEISLWDAYELNEHGTLQLKDNIDKKSFNEGKFIKTLHEMNRSNHGNYSDLHKTVIQREWYGSLFMTFRKHMYPSLKARFGKRQIDYSKGTEIEGFHRLFFKKIINDIMSYGSNITKYESFAKDKTGKGWSKEDIYSFRRSLFETLIGMVGMMVLTFILAGGDDDDEDDSTTKKWVMAVTNGLYSDLAITNPLGIFNPFTLQSEVYNEVKKMQTNPVAVQFTYKKMADFFTTLVDPDKDMDDLWTKTEKLIPIIRHTEAFTNPDDYVSGYLKYASLIGEGAIK